MTKLRGEYRIVIIYYPEHFIGKMSNFGAGQQPSLPLE